MSLWDKIITQNEIDSALIRDLSDLSYKTTKGRREKGRSLKDGIVNVGTLPFLEKPPPDAITKEMILDYQKSLTEPLKDPITGKPITDKYYPSTFAYDVSDITTIPTPINEPTLGKPADPRDIAIYEKQLKDGVAKIEKDRQKFKDEKDLLIEMKDILNLGFPATDTDGNPIRKPLTATDEANLIKDIADKEKDIQLLKQDINALYLDNGNIKKIIASIKENIQENKNLIIQHNKSINDNLQKYRENFLTQNQNKMVVEEQRPNETQEEYLQRMKDMQAEQFDMNLYEEKANLHQINMLKKNLRQIFSNDAMIENIIKSFKEEQRFIINKHFPEIREYILETYGKNNTNLSLEDIVEVITSHLERILNPPIEYNVGEDEITAAAPTAVSSIKVLDSDALDASGKPIPTDFKFGTDKNSLYIENDKEGSHVYFKIAETPEGKEILLYSTDTNEAGKFRQVMERAASGKSNDDVLRNIITNLKIDDFAKNKILNKKASKVSDLIGELKSQYSLEPIKKGLVMKKLNTLSGSKKYLRYGAGIKDPEQALPEYAYFGEIVIMLSKLYYNNILSVKMKSGRAIDGFRNAKVSNFFVDIIMNMYANKDVASLIKDLSVDEKNLMNSLLFQAKLHKKYITNTNETLSQLKEKHKVIEGEILAGNDNPKLIKELKDVLMKLYHFKAISIPAINKYLKNFE
jgi:hypothetical protein